MESKSPSMQQAQEFFIYKNPLASVLKEVHEWNIGFNNSISKILSSAELDLEIESEWNKQRDYTKIAKLELAVESWASIKIESDIILEQLSKVFEKNTDYERMNEIKNFTVKTICHFLVFKDNVKWDVVQSTLKAGSM